jgi:hypothetical protein
MMKVQYFGDVNDYRKFALLRLLAKEGGFKLGVCWMMTENDKRRDGNNRAYLGQPEKWRAFDPVLFDALRTVTLPPDLPDLQKVEKSGVIPWAIFFENMTPDALPERKDFHQECLSKLAHADFVFFDPDNGFEVSSCKIGRKGSNKFVAYDEVADHYASGQSVFIYQHFTRVKRPVLLARVSEALLARMPNAQIWSFRRFGSRR